MASKTCQETSASALGVKPQVPSLLRDSQTQLIFLSSGLSSSGGMGSLQPHPSPNADTVICKLAGPGWGPENCRAGVPSFLKGTEQPQLGVTRGLKTTSPVGIPSRTLPGLSGTSHDPGWEKEPFGLLELGKGLAPDPTPGRGCEGSLGVPRDEAQTSPSQFIRTSRITRWCCILIFIPKAYPSKLPFLRSTDPYSSTGSQKPRDWPIFPNSGLAGPKIRASLWKPDPSH